nr:MAG TPA: baseplate protein [Caudoviricetes sp.]
MGASDTYPAGSTGGSAEHTQAANEVGLHSHPIVAPIYGQVLYGGSGVSGDISGRAYVAYNTGNNVADATAFVARESYTDPKPMDILNPYYSTYIWRRVA